MGRYPAPLTDVVKRYSLVNIIVERKKILPIGKICLSLDFPLPDEVESRFEILVLSTPVLVVLF